MEEMKKMNLVTLKAEHLQLVVVPEIGGSIASFSWVRNHEVLDIFRPLKNFDADPRRVLEMGCFPLVPYSNRIRDGIIYADGVPYKLPNLCAPDPHPCHGTGWLNSWNIIDQSKHSIILELEPDYSLPIQYGASQEILLTPDKLEISLVVTNLGQNSFPVGTGLHPYFPEKNNAVISADLPTEWCLDEDSMPVDHCENMDAKEFKLMFPANSLSGMRAFTGWDGSAFLSWPAKQLDVTISTNPPLSHLLMWAPRGETFFCVEPVSHAIDGFNLARQKHKQGQNNTGGIYLKYGKSYSQKFTFSVQYNG